MESPDGFFILYKTVIYPHNRRVKQGTLMAAQNNAPLPEGLEIAGYRIVKKIASGGFSIVYLAYDADGNAVAIKEYLPSALALRQPGELVPRHFQGRTCRCSASA
jgi:serine/threonine protein kinase